MVLIRMLINISDSLVYVCSLWYISERSPLLLSFAVMSFSMPENFLIFFGPIIDRYDPRKILFRAILAEFVIILLLGVLYYYDRSGDYLLLVLLFAFSFFSTITYPIEEKVIPMIVEKEKLVEANSIVEIAYKIVDILFNGLSGLLISVFAISFLYKVNLVLLIIPIILIKLWKYEKEDDLEKGEYSFSQYRSDLIEGFRFIKTKKMFRVMIPLVICNFFLL
ncbi:MAG: MFS transporter [Peptostreptococcaceae bacterium]|nr:MFS transporter [Peptostreptococcaceae bacterium]